MSYITVNDKRANDYTARQAARAVEASEFAKEIGDAMDTVGATVARGREFLLTMTGGAAIGLLLAIGCMVCGVV